MKEEWKIFHNGLLRVSNLGNVETVHGSESGDWIPKKKSETPLKYSETGYEIISLPMVAKRASKYVHRLVYENFVSAIPCGLVINHINGIKNDNRLENLEAITQMENVHHSIKSGKGAGRKPGVTIDEAVSLTILTLYGSGYTNKSISSFYKIDPSTLAVIVNGKKPYFKFAGLVDSKKGSPVFNNGHKTYQLTNWEV